ncbi:MAG: phosphate ABC transporter periplasmic protein [Ignavibacteria bacterium]|nr:MAG: phosphate ABC transporter periplasmic protein [Ignavibacteria bacterium]KAF0160536.1 MAG: phosphate ABC transporter periplasmic protein [Ignavibacteria bacterium]
MKNLMNKLLSISIFASFLFIVSGCKQEPKETAIKGSLVCYADESLYSLIKAQRDTFVSLYPQSQITIEKLSAREGIVKMLNGEITMFVSSRGINEEESKFIEKTNLKVRVIKLCFDGLTVIVDTNHSTSRITTTELKQLLLGESKKYRVFIPDQNSGVFENLKVELLENKKPSGAFIVKNEADVVNSVIKNKNSIGVVGLNIARESKGIKILRVGTDERSVTGGEYIEPVAGYLSNGEYPLIRVCYIFLNEIGIGLGSGFSTFMTSNPGQKIVLEHDLGPATVPIRYNKMTRLK